MIFSTDLDHTLIFTERHLRGGAPVTAVEHRLGEAFSYMTPRALASLRRIQKNAVCLINTLRGYEQAMRVSFVRDASCRYLALQNGLYLYRDGAPDTDWAAHVARTVRALPLDLGGAAGQVLDGLSGIECLSKRYEYLAVFFVDERRFDDAACGQLAQSLSESGWELFRERKKLYLSPLAIDKGAVLRYVRMLEDGDEAVGFGDSWFDLPMLKACRHAYAPGESALASLPCAFPIFFSERPAQAGSEEILDRILKTCMIPHRGDK
ncbi:hypothetical protein [Anaerotruncus sp.]|jgi:hypothetical protein|uniref:hypothetical protein n=1 Tax=Anaerotruncus TaxID=244127 RepID=UPI00216F883D|nr:MULTISPECIES: hypothetical protein [Anaerotruncus]MCI8493816.1 hypothetical protein [Anaerotruncus sp.]